MIIGISGKIGTGKSVLGQHLQNLLARDHAFGEGVPVLRAFGDPLKQEVAEAFGFPLDWCYTTKGKATEIVLEAGGQAWEAFGCVATVRELMQWWGTDVRRAQDVDYWIKAFDSYVAQDLRMDNTILVPDVRFPNEVGWVLGQGGPVMMVRMEPYEGWQPGEFAGHASETSLDEYPFMERFRPGFGRLHVMARSIFTRLQELS